MTYLWIALEAVASTAVGVAAVEWAVVRLPEDFFTAVPPSDAVRRPLRRLVRNVTGALAVVFGTALLVLPGPGVLTIVLGLVLLDFPGKRRWVAALLSRPGVLATANRRRARYGRPPLRSPVGGCK